MWHTSQGDRTLDGAEAEVVAHAVDTMVDTLTNYIDEDGTDDEWESYAGFCESGIAIYDELPPTRRIALLHDVASHLLMTTTALLPLSAYTEAAVAAIYVEIRDQVSIEIDLFPDGPDEVSSDPEENVTWRDLVLAAYEAVQRRDDESWERGVELPDRLSRRFDDWKDLVDSLADAVLWDRDFEMAGAFLDESPGVSKQRRRLLGIDDDYFASISPDPLGSEVFRLISHTRSIVRTKPR